jgi:DNA-directed RNA polymerase specialized sigma24 family protein
MALDVSTQEPPFFTSKLRASILKVLRKNGVEARDCHDLFQEVMHEAAKRKDKLPTTEPERTQYFHGIARNRAKRYVWAKRREPPMVPLDAVRSAAATEEVSVETRERAEKYYAAAVKRDAEATDWLIRNKVYDERSTEIAAQDGQPVDRIRKRIERLLGYLREHANSIGMILLFVFASYALLWPREPSLVGHGRPEPEERAPDDAEQARTLREQALRECRERAWKDCLRDLDAARELDPIGDRAPDVERSREEAERALRAPEP